MENKMKNTTLIHRAMAHGVTDAKGLAAYIKGQR